MASFKWHCSYRHEVFYKVYDGGSCQEVSLLRDPETYETRRYNGTRDAYVRDVVGRVGLLCSHYPHKISAATLKEFNEWRASEFAKHKKHILANPDRYGITSENDPFLVPPDVLKSAHYEVGIGWVVDPE